MAKAAPKKQPGPERVPSLHEFQQEARANIAERTPKDLSVEEVQSIRAFKASGSTAVGIAQQFRIDRRQVSAIVKFRVRADVPRPFETSEQRSWRESKHRENEHDAKKRLEALSAKKAGSKRKTKPGDDTSEGAS
ncbi:hypothetical protein [Archangium primigenium]|uniref:hypothetical protein n=1 Tax=[Archangium] primigenium TaxID=2792470 RepID=UPI00195BE16C|nr:hypothetical protein [Archangium primigenium]MBM7117610.1 hypothetical protein [Archangium primigenium]